MQSQQLEVVFFVYNFCIATLRYMGPAWPGCAEAPSTIHDLLHLLQESAARFLQHQRLRTGRWLATWGLDCMHLAAPAVLAQALSFSEVHFAKCLLISTFGQLQQLVSENASNESMLTEVVDDDECSIAF